jgi:hypothetical protein
MVDMKQSLRKGLKTRFRGMTPVTYFLQVNPTS